MSDFASPMALFLVLGIGLFIVEMLTLSFYAVFIALGCLLVALFLYFGFSMGLSLGVGTVLSVVCIVVFQRQFQRRMRPLVPEERPFSHLIGEKGLLSTGINAVEGHGTVMLSGTAWRAKSLSPLEGGTMVVVTALDTEDPTTVVVQKL